MLADLEVAATGRVDYCASSKNWMMSSCEHVMLAAVALPPPSPHHLVVLVEEDGHVEEADHIG